MKEIRLWTRRGFFTVSDSDIVNDGTCPYRQEYNPGLLRPWLIYRDDRTVAVVFACDEDDALSLAADAGKLDFCCIAEAEHQGMQEAGKGKVGYLGKEGKPYDLTSVDMTNLKIPRRPRFLETYQWSYPDDVKERKQRRPQRKP